MLFLFLGFLPRIPLKRDALTLCKFTAVVHAVAPAMHETNRSEIRLVVERLAQTSWARCTNL